jgi:hypothetical protein
MAAQTVTFTLPGGTKVTCSQELAKKLGHAEPKPTARKAPAKSDDK